MNSQAFPQQSTTSLRPAIVDGGNRLSVNLDATTREAEFVRQIGTHLLDFGIICRVGEAFVPDAPTIVLLSAHGLLERGANWPSHDGRLIPVVIGKVDDAQVPEYIRSMNWIFWRPEDPVAGIQSIARACRISVARTQFFDSFLARVGGWVLGGRSVSDLMTSQKEIQSVEREALQSSDWDVPQSASEFLSASREQVKRRTGKRIRRIALWLAFLGIMIPGLVNLGDRVQYLHERLKLDAVAINVSAETMGPDAQALKLLALTELIRENGGTPSTQVIDGLVDLWSVPWSSETYAVSEDMKFFNAMTFLKDGTQFWVDGGGTLWRVNPNSREMLRFASGLPRVAGNIVASQDGRTWAVANEDTISLNGTASPSLISIPGLSSLVMQPDGFFMAGISQNGISAWDLTAEQPKQKQIAISGTPLKLAVLNGKLVALVRESTFLRIVDIFSGQTVRSMPDVAAASPAVAIGPEGIVVVEGVDRQLWTNSVDEWTRVPISVPDVTVSIEITPQQQLLVTGNGESTRVVDLRTGLERGTICREGQALGVAISPDGAMATCRYGAMMSLWNLKDQLPVGLGTDDKGSKSATSGDTRASITDQELTVSRAGIASDYKFTPGGTTSSRLMVLGSLSSVAIMDSSDTLAYGSTGGDLVVAEMEANGGLRLTTRWKSPDGSGITGIRWENGRLYASTSTATWVIRTCLHCTSSAPALQDAIMSRLHSCYEPDISNLIPDRILAKLKIAKCRS